MSEDTKATEQTPEQTAQMEEILKAQEEAKAEKARQIGIINKLLVELDGENYGAALQISKGLNEAVAGNGQKQINASTFEWKEGDTVEEKLGWVS